MLTASLFIKLVPISVNNFPSDHSLICFLFLSNFGIIAVINELLNLTNQSSHLTEINSFSNLIFVESFFKLQH